MEMNEIMKHWSLIDHWHGWSREKILVHLFAVKTPNLLVVLSDKQTSTRAKYFQELPLYQFQNIQSKS
jgi:hypothetical protein